MKRVFKLSRAVVAKAAFAAAPPDATQPVGGPDPERIPGGEHIDLNKPGNND